AAPGGREDARDDVEQRRLSGSVRTDEPADLRARHLQADSIERPEPAELLRHAPEGQHPHVLIGAAPARRGRWSRSGARGPRRCSSPARPRGRNKMKLARKRPDRSSWSPVAPRNSSNTTVTTIAPMIGPRNVPIPPITTMLNCEIASKSPKLPGLT